MQCLWFENRQIELIEAPCPVPVAGEALLKVLLAGICGTDLQLLNGYYAFKGTPGHEFVAEVVAAPGNDAWIGKRVVADINLNCGQCRFCTAGIPHHCERRQALGISHSAGAFAQYLVLPLQNLVEVPHAVSNEQAVFAEPLAAAAHVLDVVSINPVDKVLVLGAGKLGLLIAMVLQHTPCELHVLARYEKQKRVLENIGVQVVSEQELRERSYGIVVEATASEAGFAMALACVQAQGCIVLKSTYHSRLNMDISRVVVDEIRIIGSRCGAITQALDLLCSRAVDTASLLEASFPLQQAHAAFKLAAGKGALKILLQPQVM